MLLNCCQKQEQAQAQNAGFRSQGGGEISGPQIRSSAPQPEVQLQETGFESDFRIAIVGAGGCGRVVLDVLISTGAEDWILGFYDDSHATIPAKIRGFPVLGDIAMLKSMLSVEPVYVIVAITDNEPRLRIANSIRGLGGRFLTAIHPQAYLSGEASVGDGSVLGAGAVVQPNAVVGSHCFLGPSSVVDRDAMVGAGAWISAGAVVEPGARVGARAILGSNSSVARKAEVEADAEIPPGHSVARGGRGGRT